jgi:hypothetical protein
MPATKSETPEPMVPSDPSEPLAAEAADEPGTSPASPQPNAPPPPLPRPIVRSLERDPHNLDEVVEWMGDIAKQQRRAALALLVHRPLDPEPYLLLRAIVWSKAGALRIDEKSRKVALRSPESTSDPLADIPERPSTDDLLRTERQVAANPFWLDLTIRSIRILERLGPEADAARLSIRVELQALLLRRPDLRDALMPDGRPLLAAEIEGLEPLGDRLCQASTRSSAGRGASASIRPTSLDSIGRLRGGRDRFEASLAVVSEKKLSGLVTLDLLESLLEVSDSHDLESWDPALASALFEQVIVVSKGEGDRWERVRNRARLGLARTAPDRLISIRSKSADR